MISSFIISTIVYLLSFAIGLLPIGYLPAAVASSIVYLSAVLNTFNYIFPISHLFIILSLVITIELILWVFHAFLWVYNKVRGI